MARILVTGGAGYIGSHVVRQLLANNQEVLVFDNLETGHREAVPGHLLVQGDLKERVSLDQLFAKEHFDGVVHFAAHSLVGESVANPQKYFMNNVGGGLNLLQAMLAHGVRNLVFSSTAATYGEPIAVPIREDHPLSPLSPYGESKWMFEQILRRHAQAYGLRYAALRYFNAAGADPSGEIGEDHDPETHLIPLVLKTALGQRQHIQLFGTDYPTIDGTCVRDYVHVTDLAEAHLLALEAVSQQMASGAYNLGNGNGYSVKQVVQTAEAITGRQIRVIEAGRRAGDPAILIASPARAETELGWRPKRVDLHEIMLTAWHWHQLHPYGYAGEEQTLV